MDQIKQKNLKNKKGIRKPTSNIIDVGFFIQKYATHDKHRKKISLEYSKTTRRKRKEFLK